MNGARHVGIVSGNTLLKTSACCLITSSATRCISASSGRPPWSMTRLRSCGDCLSNPNADATTRRPLHGRKQSPKCSKTSRFQRASRNTGASTNHSAVKGSYGRQSVRVTEPLAWQYVTMLRVNTTTKSDSPSPTPDLPAPKHESFEVIVKSQCKG